METIRKLLDSKGARGWSVDLDQGIRDCMALMTKERVRHLPVIDDGRVVGVVSIGDIVKSIIDNQDLLIKQPEHYIAGSL